MKGEEFLDWEEISVVEWRCRTGDEKWRHPSVKAPSASSSIVRMTCESSGSEEDPLSSSLRVRARGVVEAESD